MKKGVILASLFFVFLAVLSLTFIFDPNKVLDVIMLKDKGDDFNPHVDYRQTEDIPTNTGGAGGSPSSSSGSGGGSSAGTGTDDVDPSCYVRLSYSIQEFQQLNEEGNLDCSLYIKNLDRDSPGDFTLVFNQMNSEDTIINSKELTINVAPGLRAKLESSFIDPANETSCEYETLVTPVKNVC